MDKILHYDIVVGAIEMNSKNNVLTEYYWHLEAGEMTYWNAVDMYIFYDHVQHIQTGTEWENYKY